MIIMLTKLQLQLSILLDHDDDEYHPNRNAIKIATTKKCDDEPQLKAMIMLIIISNKLHDNNNYHAYLITFLMTMKTQPKVLNIA